MPGRRVVTLDVRELIRRLRAGQTDRAIARDLKMSRKTVGKYRELAEKHQLLEGPLPRVGELDQRLNGILAASPPPQAEYKAEEHRDKILKWLKEDVSGTAMYDRLVTEHGFRGSRSGVYRYLLRLKGGKPEAFVRVEVEPGEEAQVDFGYAGRMVDPRTGKERKAWVFVMTLSHSRHQYATFVFDQTSETWLSCHREAFEWFGGVPTRVVVDNLKAAITKAVWQDPVVQRSYREFAEHYGFLISPCRVRTPRHKGKVESGVKYLKRNFLAGRRFRDVVEANRRLLEWVEKTAGMRIHGTTRERPLARFLEVEKEKLQPLPLSSYDMGVWKEVKLHPDCHVVVDYAFYSAPHRLIGEKLWVRTNRRDVWIYHAYERVATHTWGPPGTRRTNPDHYPPEKVVYLMRTPAVCREKAQAIGPATLRVVEGEFGDRALDRLRTVQGILRLGEKYGPKRLEAACRRGLAYRDPSRRALQRMLERGLENEPLPEEEVELPVASSTQYVFARPGSEIFVNR